MMYAAPAEVVARLARTRSLLVVCEFDGAIAEFVTDPATARPVDGAMEALRSLATLPRTRAAVISGRALESLDAVCSAGGVASRCGIELIGSDGMEIESQLTLGLTADARRMQRRLLREAAQIANAHPGVTVDAKPYGVALHVRGAAAVEGRQAIDQMLDIARSMPLPVYSQSRSEVLDLSVLPVAQDWAIDALRQRGNATVCYVGSDQRAMASLGPADVSCSVGPGCEGAMVCIESPLALADFLRELHFERAALSG